MRQTRSLSGTWQFQPDPEGQFIVGTISPSRTIPVPLPWQAVFDDMRLYSGYAWYQRTFDLSADWLAGEVLLTFGAVDYWCEVFVNGGKAGEHEGGYTPFTFAVRHLLHEGSNQLTVRVYDVAQQDIRMQRQPRYPVDEPGSGPPFGPLSVLHGKQEWYINVGGIWQDVTLTAVPRTYIDVVRVTPALDGSVRITTGINGAAVDDWTVDATVLWEGQVVAQASQPVSGGNTGELMLHVPSPRLWSPDQPSLYNLRVRVGEDEASQRFGFREIATRGGLIYLNNEPLYLIAALDQDFYPETIYTPPSDDYLRDQFRKAKELGLNCLRCHIKVPDPRYLDLADEMGLLIWGEIPSWRTFYIKGTYHSGQVDLDDTIKRRVENTLQAMIERDDHHPSLIIWTLVNEDWGTMLSLSAADRAWLRSLYRRCKQLDPTRLVVDNSPCLTAWGPNVHVQSDLDDWHIYTNIPDAAPYFVQAMEQLNLRPLWTYSSHGDSERRGDEPVIVSEFGNWGLASVQPYLAQNSDQEPAWFNLGPWWSGWEGEPGWIKGVLERFRRFGLEAVFGDYEAFAIASQWHQHHALKFEIETMRRMSAIMGYVITEFTDLYWECNGLLDFDRRPKAFHDVMRQFNALDVFAAQPSRYAIWDNEILGLRPFVSHFSPRDWSEAKLQVTLDGQVVEASLTDVTRGAVEVLPAQTWRVPPVQQAEIKTFDLRATDSAGQELAHNRVQVLVLPSSAARAAYTGPLAMIENIVPGSETLAQQLLQFETVVRSIGYNAVRSLNGDTKLALSMSPTPELLRWVRAGGDLLFLCVGVSPFFWPQSRGGAYSGNWMTGWSWLRPGVHRRLDHQEMNPLKLPLMDVMPKYTIVGLPVESSEIQPDLLAGQFTGWINHPAVHTVQFHYGQGRVVMTTFALAESLGADPVATAMFHDLIDHLAEGRCQPTLQSNR